MPTEHSEEQLIYAAQGGDKEAFAQLYEANVEQVYRYLLRRTGQPADAEDVTTEVFIRAMRALPSFEFKGVPFIAWLLRIAHNSAVNHLKKQNRRREVPINEPAIMASDDPVDLVMQRVTSDEVVAAMSSLTELQQEVVKLRFVRQLSISETAARMDRTEGAVKFLQHSAIRALRRVLTDQEATAIEK